MTATQRHPAAVVTGRAAADRLWVRPALHARRDPGRRSHRTQRDRAGRQVGVVIAEDRLPVRRKVIGAGVILGIDPLHVANEGKLVAN